jgi:MSHA biogenesis protein MshQ
MESFQTVKNATLTILGDLLWRWRRRVARALLVMGALAGMTVGTVAHAQVAFRSASSATQPVPTFRAASSAIQSAPPAPAFQAAGTAVSATGAVTPAWPAHEIDDIALLFIESAGGEAATLSTAAGFAAVANSPQATGTTTNGTRITVFWARATSTAMASPTVADPGNHVYAQILTYRGVFASGNPWDVTGGGVKAAASTSVTVTGVTTTVANTLVVQAVARDNDSAAAAFSAQTNGNLTGIAERSDAGTTQNNGGGFAVWDGIKATAGATGNTTATVTSSINAFLTVALRPMTSALTITKPAGTIQNDVMIASFGFRTNQPGLSTDVDITPPSGWTLVRRLDNPGPTDSGLAVYQKVAGAAEPASYRWGLTCIATCATNGFQAAAGGITSFSNVNTTTPVDVENGQVTAIGAQTAPSVTTTAANAMLVASHSYASAGTWTPPPASGGDGAMTEAVDILSGAQSTEMSYVLHAAAGATAAKQATPAPDDDEGNAHILALRPALQSSITINKPAGTIVNDVMIASIGFSPNTLTIPTVPAGWTLVRRVDNANGNANSLVVYRKTAGAAEPANYAWTFSAAGYLAGGISTFSGVDTTTPVDIENGNCTQQGSCATTTLSHATPSVATTVANTMLVTSHTYSSAGTWVPPGAMTEAVEVQHGTQSLGVNYVLQAAAGATGTKTATASTQADVGNAHILALRPAVIVVPPPGSLNAFETSTAAGAIAGQIYSKLAGTAFSLDIVAILGGVQQAAFTDTVQVDLVTGSTGGLNCPGTPVTIAGTTQSVNLTSGRGTTGAFNVANAYRDVRVRMRYPVVSPTVTSCSTDNFTIRPAAFSAPTSNMTNALTSGAPVANAGAAFTITAVAIAGYDGTPSTDNTKITAHAGAIQNGAVGGTFGAANPATGTATGAAFAYSEVGNFTIGINGVLDNTFTNASADQGNGDCTADFSNSLVGGRYGCYFGNSSASAAIGRFTPDHFDALLNTPTFATACGAGNFTYVGQAFNYTVQPVITVTAKNSAGLGNATTQNYTGASWFKLTNGSLTGKSYTAATGTVDTGGVAGTDPVVADTGAGTASITFSSGTGLFFARSTPVAPFDSEISLAINVIDGDTPAIVYALNPARFSVATPGNGIAFNNGKQMRFGRLAIRNANGSQLVPLPVQVEAQYWGYTNPPINTVLGFITNTADGCTSIASANDAMGNYTSNLSGSPTCETAISGGGTLSSGRRTLQLAAPGSGNNGSVDLTVNLGASASGNTCTTLLGAPVSATTANLPHLQGNWTGGTYTVNPSARATFGVFKGAEEVIFVRENF